PPRRCRLNPRAPISTGRSGKGFHTSSWAASVSSARTPGAGRRLGARAPRCIVAFSFCISGSPVVIGGEALDVSSIQTLVHNRRFGGSLPPAAPGGFRLGQLIDFDFDGPMLRRIGSCA